MPDELRLPNLAPQGFDELFTSLRDAIPTLSANWTDFNLSDPGITVLQLLAHVAEVTSYRIDRIPPASYRNFLLLAAGTTEEGLDRDLAAAARDIARAGTLPASAGGEPVSLDPRRLALLQFLAGTRSTSAAASPAAMHAAAATYWTDGDRAVSADDFRRLAIECTAAVPAPPAPESMEKVVQAFVRARGPRIQVDVASGYQPHYDHQSASRAAGVLAAAQLTLRPQPYSAALGYARLTAAVSAYLQRRALLGTAVDVQPARYDAYAAELDVTPVHGCDYAGLLEKVATSLTAWFDPLTGGSAGAGWPYGTAPTESDLVNAVRRVPGVDPSQPVQARLTAIAGLALGSALLGHTTVLASSPDAPGFPVFPSVTLRALRSTAPATVGRSTRLGTELWLFGGAAG